ncbi:hypothetical protein HPB58_09325 [Priestia filamentosa]|uniref:hypothetical protein n=1 Tax=Priestia filamentosa TaxID=1402861 RepID=UPI001FB2B178|nr:hypothetical protein [Priestia filamentosa]MED3728872.1 hypothetical protein [Priestia filamentosa]UOE62357.1 hypothetical protein HPB58_09325 [Priestia filamentosa]
MLSLSMINKQYEEVLLLKTTHAIKFLKLSHLLTYMRKKYFVPPIENEKWETENRKVIALYRKIIISRNSYKSQKLMAYS